ncbi:relaxase/mobilization nuclease domain-containing protein [Klebsiella michiganensis]|uniref:relaxase/mobilization nuclease domain-containing protein n=1 Tax=Klebsiella michiganensis TaxID=1134687 RepID=UPI00351A419A|nr:relaxase/mobilization nuclease domain-containing protein [Klebsiella oxytoca]
MKGMQKIRRGKNFIGIVLYALKPDSHHRIAPVVIGGNMDGCAAKDLITEFNLTKTLRPDVDKPVWHNSLRLPKDEVLTDAQWSAIADDYMKRIGFSETHLRCYVLHDDAVGQHIHIIASRIDRITGKLYLGKNENLISTRIIQQLEHDYSLLRTKGPKIKTSSALPCPKLTRKKTRNEVMQEKRTGEQCPKTIIQNALETLVSKRVTTTEFVQQLFEQNINALPNITSTGKMNGFSFEYAGIAFKASQLGKCFSWSTLQGKLDYRPESDNDFLFDLKATITKANANEILKENVKSSFEAFIIDRHAGKDESAVAYVEEKCFSEALAGSKKAIATKAVKEMPNQSYEVSAFRWMETIPYLDTIYRLLRQLKIPILRRPAKHQVITEAMMIEIHPINPKNTFVEPLLDGNLVPPRQHYHLTCRF